METLLKITRHPYEEPYHLNLDFQASNGRQAGFLEIYCVADDLRHAARELSVFPRHSSDVFVWEIGSEYPEDRFGFYFRFRAFTLDSRGSCAIQFRFNNNQELRYREMSEFCIEAEASKINLLAQLIHEFAGLQHSTLWWDTQSGGLDDELARTWSASQPPVPS